MGIRVVCDDCGGEFKAKDEHAGRKVSCPECGESIRIPDPDSPRRSSSGRSSGRRSSGSRSGGGLPGWAWAAIGAGGVAVVALVAIMIFGGRGDAPQQVANQAVAQPTVGSSADPNAAMNPSATPNAAAIPAGHGAMPNANPAAANPMAVASNTTALPGHAAVQPTAITNPMPMPMPVAVATTTPSNTGTATLTPMATSTASVGVPSGGTYREKPYASVADLIEAVEPSVVRITIKMPDGGEGAGSGYVVDTDGTVVTNRHVVEGAASCTARFPNDKTEYLVLGTYFLDEKRDIAVVKINAPKEKLKPLSLAKEFPRKGEQVVAFGAPLGLDFTTTQGIISAVRDAEELMTLGIVDHEGTWLQHSVPISPGNSGGPLVTMNGEMVGMNTMTLVIGQNLNFAISSKDVLDGISKKSPSLSPIKPSAIPERRSRSKQPSPPKDIVGTDQAKEFLGQIKTMDIIMARAGFDPTRRITATVRGDFEKALENCKIRTQRGGQSFMMVAMEIEDGAGTKAVQQLSITSVCFFRGEDGQIYKIWDEREKLGTVSDQLFFQGGIPKTMRSNISKYFGKFSGAVNRSKLEAERAKKSAATGSSK